MDEACVILYNNTFMGIKERFMAVATNEEAARRWIHDEVNDVFTHPKDPPKYAPGISVENYLEAQIFVIKKVGVFG
jgi:hypothetical protein